MAFTPLTPEEMQEACKKDLENGTPPPLMIPKSAFPEEVQARRSEWQDRVTAFRATYHPQAEPPSSPKAAVVTPEDLQNTIPPTPPPMRFVTKLMALMVDQGMDGLLPLIADGGSSFRAMMAQGFNPTEVPGSCAARAWKIWIGLNESERKALLEAIKLTASDLGYPPEGVVNEFLSELTPSARREEDSAVPPTEKDGSSHGKLLQKLAFIGLMVVGAFGVKTLIHQLRSLPPTPRISGVATTAPSIESLRKAAEQGNAVAQRSLGICYANGRGVDKDQRQAVKWYQKAAEQGDMEAQGLLGGNYLYGLGVEKDELEGVRWYRSAAERG